MNSQVASRCGVDFVMAYTAIKVIVPCVVPGIKAIFVLPYAGVPLVTCQGFTNWLSANEKAALPAENRLETLV